MSKVRFDDLLITADTTVKKLEMKAGIDINGTLDRINLLKQDEEKYIANTK